MSTTERWRLVAGFPDYQVSNHGRVASRKRQAELILSQPKDGHGYCTVTLHGAGQRRVQAVHRLVAEAFLGPRPDGLEVRHLDGDRDNNHVSNLAYGTHAENMQDRLRHGRHPMVNRTHCPSGHEYTPENTYIQGAAKGRVCRMCKKARRRRADRERQSLRSAGLEASA